MNISIRHNTLHLEFFNASYRFTGKAKEKQITTNANAVYIAAQSLLDEQYALAASTKAADTLKKADVESLASLKTTVANWDASYSLAGTTGKDGYKISSFEYKEDGKVVQLQNDGSWKNIGATITTTLTAMA